MGHFVEHLEGGVEAAEFGVGVDEVVGYELDVGPAVGGDDGVELLGSRKRADVDACFEEVGDEMGREVAGEGLLQVALPAQGNERARRRCCCGGTQRVRMYKLRGKGTETKRFGA